MIRVVHIIGKMNRAGAETMLMNIYRNIDRSKIQFDFITFTREKGDYDDEIISLGGKIIPLDASNSFSRMIELYFLLKRNNYKIIHTHVLLNNAFHLISAKLAKIPHRISHSHNTSNGKNNFIKHIYEKISIYINRKLSTFKIACGQEAGKYLFKEDSDVFLLKNGIELSNLIKEKEKNLNYWENLIPIKNKIKIIQVGRLEPVKNHLFSINIAKKLNEKNIDFIFLIVGQGTSLNNIKNEIENFGLNDKIHLLGVRSDVPQLMAGADIMLMPSLHEGFPVVLVESQALGLKSLVSDRISSEVDLGLNLVKKLPLESNIDLWVDQITTTDNKKTNKNENLETLKKNGFDVIENAKLISNVYKNML